MKKSILISLLIISLFFSGCSSKNGAIVGGTTGVIAGGFLGVALKAQAGSNDSNVEAALQVGLVLGLVGALIGSTTGYVVSEINKDEDKKMQEMIQSQKTQGL